MYIHAGGIILVEVNWLFKILLFTVTVFASETKTKKISGQFLILIMFKFCNCCVSSTQPPRKTGKKRNKKRKKR